jgi:hypothetical protein
MTNWWANLRNVWANTDWSWIVLWLGLSMLILALFVLMRTRWGQSQPLGKCAVLSLLAHLLLAVYATTVQIVTASSGTGRPPTIHASLVDADDWDEIIAAQRRLVAEPWQNSEPSAVSSPDIAQPIRLAPTASDLSNTRAQSAALEETPPSVDLSPDLPAAPAVPPLAQNDRAPRSPAEAIDEPQPTAAVTPNEVLPEVAGPERVLPSALTAAAQPRTEPAPTAGDAEKTTTDVGLTDPLSNLPGDMQFNTGQSPFQAARAPASIAAAEPTPQDESQSTTTAGGSNSANNGAASRLVPVNAVRGANDAAGAVPPIYQDRVSEDRQSIVRKRGGSPETEAAVQAALKWLANNQSSDGRWDADRHGAGREQSVLGHDRNGAGAKADTAMTGLALLAFLGAGQTHLDGKYKENVKRGLEHLLTAQAQDGNLAGEAEMFAFMYSHGIATLALSEAYAMTGDTRLERPLRAAIGYTIRAQHPSTGAWRYRANEPGDTSQLGWQLMALKSAELAGVPMPEKTREGMVRFVKSVSSGANGGLASYRPRERATRPMTAEALVCRQFLGMTRDNPAANEAGDYLLAELPSAERINLYYWYYGTLGMYQLQGDHWQQWNAALQQTLVARQVGEGSGAGSWDPDCIWAGYGGRVYSTAMATLCLEVYYRYLPIYGEFGPDVREAKRP